MADLSFAPAVTDATIIANAPPGPNGPEPVDAALFEGANGLPSLIVTEGGGAGAFADIEDARPGAIYELDDDGSNLSVDKVLVDDVGPSISSDVVALDPAGNAALYYTISTTFQSSEYVESTVITSGVGPLNSDLPAYETSNNSNNNNGGPGQSSEGTGPITVADFNGDGISDYEYNGSYYLGDGKGGFQPAAKDFTPTSDTPPIDLNLTSGNTLRVDGLNYSVQASANGVLVTGIVDQNSDAHFLLQTAGTPEFVGVADVNDDGLPDIVTVDTDGEIEVIMKDTAPCYSRGTRILTTRGDVAVENLLVGDLAVTSRELDRSRPIRWLGHRRMTLTGHPRPHDANPVRICAGALGHETPRRDLLVSPGHRLPLNGELLRAVDLVNGATIVQEQPSSIEYWHVELDQHDILFAEGTPAESYLDTGNRNGFENGLITVLHPVLDAEGATPCLPYAAPSTALRAHLADRAVELGWSRTQDPQPWLEVDGGRIEPMRRGNRYRFRVPTGCTEARLCSHAARAADTDATSTDWRTLGLAVVSITLCLPSGARGVRLDNDLLTVGFSHVERDGDGWCWRWTDGSAMLPMSLLACGEQVNAIEIAIDVQTLEYWQEPARDPSSARPSVQGRAALSLRCLS